MCRGVAFPKQNIPCEFSFFFTARVFSTREDNDLTHVCPSICLSTGGGGQVQPGGGGGQVQLAGGGGSTKI